ncbi:MAG: DUF3380 domain-containing protein [Rhodospirillales bacterium]|nr:DUF3380 domain-containing protein [Rhodospirillales bacterium]
MEFKGQGKALSPAGLATAADTLGVNAAAMWAVLSVETRGAGFLSDRRPIILFERHVFSRRTGRRFDHSHPAISNVSFGGYGRSGAQQYERLANALSLDRRAALESASWGLGQVMGHHAERLGYGHVEQMVAAMAEGEDAQLAAMAGFIRAHRRCHRALMALDWTAFARIYNGPGYARNNYHRRLEQQYRRWLAGPLPDLAVREAQLQLRYLGYSPGPIDGLIGRFTRQALVAFQGVVGLPQTGDPDESTLQQLAA